MRLRLPLVCLLLCVVPALRSAAQSKQASTADYSLRGLRAVTVVIDGVSTIHPVGMKLEVPSTERIQEYIEQRLRSAGISVLRPGEESGEGPTPSLHFSLETQADEHGYNYYSSRLRLIEEVMLQRLPSQKVNAVTWDVGGPGSGKGGRLFESLICKDVTSFIRAYTEVNAESPQRARSTIDFRSFVDEHLPCYYGFDK